MTSMLVQLCIPLYTLSLDISKVIVLYKFCSIKYAIFITTDYGRPVRKLPSLHGRKSNPNPKFLGTAKGYFVCRIGPNFQISLLYAFTGCPQSVLLGIKLGKKKHVTKTIYIFNRFFLYLLQRKQFTFHLFQVSHILQMITECVSWSRTRQYQGFVNKLLYFFKA